MTTTSPQHENDKEAPIEPQPGTRYLAGEYPGWRP